LTKNWNKIKVRFWKTNYIFGIYILKRIQRYKFCQEILFVEFHVFEDHFERIQILSGITMILASPFMHQSYLSPPKVDWNYKRTTPHLYLDPTLSPSFQNFLSTLTFVFSHPTLKHVASHHQTSNHRRDLIRTPVISTPVVLHGCAPCSSLFSSIWVFFFHLSSSIFVLLCWKSIFFCHGSRFVALT